MTALHDEQPRDRAISPPKRSPAPPRVLPTGIHRQKPAGECALRERRLPLPAPRASFRVTVALDFVCNNRQQQQQQLKYDAAFPGATPLLSLAWSLSVEWCEAIGNRRM
eukprot:6692425-Prymnesium_polylepis.2